MKGDVVVLIHGIRDHALWVPVLEKVLVKAGYEVRPASYGRFRTRDFMSRADQSRDAAKKLLSDKLLQIRAEFPTKPIHVIAHSFGTYLVTQLLTERARTGYPASDYTHVFGGRLIVCGSVAHSDFPFGNHAKQFAGKVINEIGTRDYWPAIARFIRPLYGAPGTYGFKSPLVVDRWHAGLGHSGFLKAEFCKKWWVPILDGDVLKTGDNPEPLPFVINWMGSYTLRQVWPWLSAAGLAVAALISLTAWWLFS